MVTIRPPMPEFRAASFHRPVNEGATPLYHAERFVTSLLARGANIHTGAYSNIISAEEYIYEGNNKPFSRLIRHSEGLYNSLIEQGTPPSSVQGIYEILSVWPLKNPKQEVDRADHLRQLFEKAKWKNPMRALSIVNKLEKNGENAELCAQLRQIVEYNFATPTQQRLVKLKKRGDEWCEELKAEREQAQHLETKL